MNEELERVVDGLDEQVLEHVSAVESLFIANDLSEYDDTERVEEDASEADGRYDQSVGSVYESWARKRAIINRRRT